MQLPSIDELVAIYSQSRASDIGQSENRLFQSYGLEPLIPLLVEAYPHIRRSAGRASILFWLVRFARTHPAVVSLATSALSDRAYLVREYACSILAYSLRREVLPQLTSLQAHPDQRTRAAAAAAVDAISHNNHHYFVDREHTGNTFWGVNSGDMPDAP
ncbi:MAG TPA: hypothetical protein VFK24_04840 [Gammaproteobacteria bacterium]|nr:hypothetical protein [Gammaproteobacteria bacterium]